jgi:hypothetical protein
MHLLDLTLPTPAENLACDEALLDLCEEGGAGEVLRFWEPREYFVVVGYANKVASEVNVNACRGLVQPDGTIKEVLSSPSPPAEGGEGRGEEGRVLIDIPSPRPSPHSSVVGKRELVALVVSGCASRSFMNWSWQCWPRQMRRQIHRASPGAA